MNLEFAIASLIVALIYFFPTFLAALRRHNDVGAILALNLLLGWTVLGWIVGLIWSLTGNTKNRHKI